MRILTALLTMLALALPAGAAAAPSLVEVGRFDRPVRVTSPPNDGRLFVVEQHTGRVRIVDQTGTILAQPFLDVGGEIAKENEQGLLSIAFARDYEATGYLYAYLTPPGKVEIRQFQRVAGDPDRAAPTGRTIFSAAHPRTNHNGGLVTFGPDDHLWFGTGDGGSRNDPDGNGQNTSTPHGKLHRVDPASFAPAQGNPFGSVFAYGLRNPWRFSFDRQTGDLVIGDVGQNAREEIDFAPAASGRGNGANYGWRCYEGTIPTAGVAPCDPPGHVRPVHELTHQDGACSITGGVVVRDPGVPSLAGRYLYGDVCKPQLRSLTLPGARDDRAEAALDVEQVVDIAEDACGRVLVSSLAGSVYRLVEGSPRTCSFAPAGGGDGAGGGGGPEPPAPAPAASCGLRLRAFGARASTVRRKGLLVRASVRGRCRVSASARLEGGGILVARGRSLSAGQRAGLRLRVSGPRTRALLRRALRRRRSLVATVSVGARPSRGAAEFRVRRVRIRR
jgi:glucose/arabinose dehydrogenase